MILRDARRGRALLCVPRLRTAVPGWASQGSPIHGFCFLARGYATPGRACRGKA